MMKLLGILALYQVVSARFVFLDNSGTKLSQQDDMYSNLLSDINLDISFENRKSPMWSNNKMNMNMNNMMNNMNSMFSFPAFPSASSFIDAPPRDIMSRQQQPSSKPLYLLVESLSHPSHQRKSSSMFVLEETSKVNGNTWRYSVKSDGHSPAIITESWSTPTMYLCNSKSCGRDHGMQMMDIVNNFRNSFGERYMHLVPSTTVETKTGGEESQPMMMMNGEEAPMMGHMGHMGGGMMQGCRNRMQRLKDWYYGSDVVQMDEDNESGGEIVILDNDQELVKELMVEQESDDIMLLAMSIIMFLVMFCGLCYVGWRCMAERKEKGTMAENGYYVAMGENDQF